MKNRDPYMTSIRNFGPAKPSVWPCTMDAYPVAVELYRGDKTVRAIVHAFDADALVNRWLQHGGGSDQQRVSYSRWAQPYAKDERER